MKPRLFAIFLTLAAALALQTSLPSFAADDAPKLTLGGSARVRSEGNDRTDYSTTRDFFTFRIRPDFILRADPTVTVFFEPQASKSFGELSTSFNSSSGSTALTQKTSGTSPYFDSPVGIHQAYVDYHPNTSVQLLAGRQIISYGDELVFGASDWNNIGRSFDALRLKMSYWTGGSDLFYSKIVDTNTTASGAGDFDLFGLYNSYDLGKGLHSADLYILHQMDNSISGGARIEAIGLRLKSRLEGLDYLGERFRDALNGADYRLEATQEFGNAVSDGDSAYQLDVELGYTLNSRFKPRLAIEAAISGKNYNQLYPSPHKWLGYADIFGRRNVTDYVIHASSLVTDALGIQLDFHKLQRTSTDTAAFSTNGTTAIGKALASGSSDLGTELDLTARYNLSSSLGFAIGGSVNSSGAYFTDQFGDVTPGFYYAMLEVKI
jgi:hypothetical protein